MTIGGWNGNDGTSAAPFSDNESMLGQSFPIAIGSNAFSPDERKSASGLTLRLLSAARAVSGCIRLSRPVFSGPTVYQPSGVLRVGTRAGLSRLTFASVLMCGSKTASTSQSGISILMAGSGFLISLVFFRFFFGRRLR